MANKTSIDDIINSQFTEMKDLSKESNEPVGWLDSGNMALNYICSRNFEHGYPMGQITGFYGKSGVGKSMLPAIAGKDPKLDKVIVFDSEGGGTGSSLFNFIDADLSKVRYMSVQTLDSYRISKKDGKIEEVKDSEVKALETKDYVYHMGLILVMKKLAYSLEYSHSDEKVLIIIDSLSNIRSVRTTLLGGEDMGKTQKLLNNLFGAIDSVCKNTNTTILLALKTYTDLNNQYNVEGIINGGESVIYNPSLLIGLSALQDNPEDAEDSKRKEKESRKTAIGSTQSTVRARIKKSRFGTLGKVAWLKIDQTYGFTRFSGLLQLLIDYGVAKKEGTRYVLPECFETKPFYKKDSTKVFYDLFGVNKDKNLPQLQSIMEEIEAERKRKALALADIDDVDDGDEEEEEGISLQDMMEEAGIEEE